MNPSSPIYIVSKGRWDTRMTSRALQWMGVPHYLVIEEQEYDQYAAVKEAAATLLVLDKQYQRDYDTFDDLGDTKGKGPGAARNFAWDHSISLGASAHWVMDDNIRKFFRRYNNMRIPVKTGTIFRCMEDFMLRYDNVGMVGPNYYMFVTDLNSVPPFVLNTRIYSCNLIKNSVPYRWRGRYNEDTDLSLRMLKDGLCTVQFNAFLQCKTPTQKMKGGNTDMFYAKEGTLAKSQMQVKMHPDISSLVIRFGRWHHLVDYSCFRTMKLHRKPGVVIQDGINNYGMMLQVDPPGTLVAVDEPDMQDEVEEGSLDELAAE